MLKQKYYFDELYNWAFVRPSIWFADTFVSIWMDRKVIDGALHWFASLTPRIGVFLRTYIDKLLVNGFGDMVGEVRSGLVGPRDYSNRRIQQYMVSALVTVAVLSAIFYYLLVLNP